MLAGEISKHYLEMDVKILVDGATLLPGFPKESIAIAERVLGERGVTVERNCRLRTVSMEKHPVIVSRDGTKRKVTRAYLCQVLSP